VVDVEMREEDCLDRLELGDGDLPKAPFAAVKQQWMLGLSRVNSDQHRIVASWFSQDFVADSHGFVFPACTTVQG
jgi:hypothetical protein